MELFSQTPSIFSPKFSFKTCKKKAPSRISIPNSRKFLLPPTFSPYLPSCTPSRFKLYAHFRPPNRRQNYLRKKLTERQQPLHQQEVSRNPIYYNPNFRDSVEANSDNFIEKRFNLDDNYDPVDKMKELESKQKILGDSVLWNKLESWVEQYKVDIEYWGIGNSHIFTVFQDSEGKINRVEVDEDEIVRRSGIEPAEYKDSEGEDDVLDVKSKILYARNLAREMEEGNNVIARNSSVAKFVVSGSKSGFVNVIEQGTSGFVSAIQGVTRTPRLVPEMRRIGVAVVVGFMVVLAAKKLFPAGEATQEYTSLEKEMLRRKLKARAEKEKIVKGSVEVLEKTVVPETEPMERPSLDREELMQNIIKAKGSGDRLAIPEHLGGRNSGSEEFSNKIQEIRAMARRAREIEKRDKDTGKPDGEDIPTVNVLSDQKEEVLHEDGYMNSQVNFAHGHAGPIKDDDVTVSLMSSNDLIKNGEIQSSTSSNVTANAESSIGQVGDEDQNLFKSSPSIVEQQSDREECKHNRKSLRPRLRVIRSVEEAREYLSRKREKKDEEKKTKVENGEQGVNDLTKPSEAVAAENMSQKSEKVEKLIDASSAPRDLTHASENNTITREEYVSNSERNEAEGGGEDGMADNDMTRLCIGNEGNLVNQASETHVSFPPEEREADGKTSHKKNNGEKTISPSILDETLVSYSNSVACKNPESENKASSPEQKIYLENVEEERNLIDIVMPKTSASHEHMNGSAAVSPSQRTENWMKKNFHELQPIIKKMGVGFRDNYMVAKEKENQDLNSKLKSDGDGGELEWMKDEKLRDIVFRVRDNELAGKDPFHQMGDEDKLAFFNGLEKKVEEENKKLVNLHEWLHSNIENLDYGTDGISLYDPPEKIIPRWKGPPLDNIPDFLNKSVEERIEALENNKVVKPKGQSSLQITNAHPSHDIGSSPSTLSNRNPRVEKEISKSSKTIIEGSDGSVRAGKKSGKEFWQHTKKWSQGFLDSYNAETDSEVKSVMKDMGKDLDRWITEKEVQEAAELMDKLPEKGQKFVKEKLDKVRRQMELFGPQAVVSKYKEYADEKEEDYLWWLDLPYVLCIELYTEEEGEQRVGLYSLEMAPDLELDPKPCHVIAFEDAGDSKSLCYVIQHHMEMLGNGNAFVVARPPKDAFREAKANGFSVSVIRKGELQLNVDQTLEEVEELITEIGSKIYHDKIMRERSVDMSGLMKGVFGSSRSSKRRRSKRKLKKPTKP